MIIPKRYLRISTTLIAVIFGGAAGLLGGCATVRSGIRPGSYPPAAPVVPGIAGPDTQVKILLLKNTPSLKLASTAPVSIFYPPTQRVLDRLQLSPQFVAAPQGNGIQMGRNYFPVEHLRILPANGHFLQVNGCRYRGAIDLLLRSGQGKLWVVNVLEVEDYLKGVVPNEMNPGWPPEALKAQAVAARTFTFYQMKFRNGAAYDLESGTNSQVYRGLDSEQASTSQAVAATRRLVAAFQGRLISAFYHSNCGGHTADVRDVWGSDIEYLKGVPCGYCDQGPHASWSYEIPAMQLEAVLTKANVPVSGILSLSADGRTAEGRVARVKIRHEHGVESLKAPAFRMALGPDCLKSTNFEVSRSGDRFAFSGQGWGHGVGLCQEGASAMAQNGFRFDQIIRYYYPGVEIQRLK